MLLPAQDLGWVEQARTMLALHGRLVLRISGPEDHRGANQYAMAVGARIAGVEDGGYVLVPGSNENHT